MPVEFEYLDNSRGVLIRAFGDVAGVDLIKTMNMVFNDEATTINYTHGICDFTGIENFDISHKQIFSLSEIHVQASKLNPHIVVGFAINKPLVYGLVRVWMVYATITGWKVHIEKELDAITGWVKDNLPTDQEGSLVDSQE